MSKGCSHDVGEEYDTLYRNLSPKMVEFLHSRRITLNMDGASAGRLKYQSWRRRVFKTQFILFTCFCVVCKAKYAQETRGYTPT